MRKTTLAPDKFLRSVLMEKSCLGRADYPLLYNVQPGCSLPREVVPGQRKTHENSNRLQTIDRGKVNPRATDLPRVKQLPQVHVIKYLEPMLTVTLCSLHESKGACTFLRDRQILSRENIILRRRYLEGL